MGWVGSGRLRTGRASGRRCHQFICPWQRCWWLFRRSSFQKISRRRSGHRARASISSLTCFAGAPGRPLRLSPLPSAQCPPPYSQSHPSLSALGCLPPSSARPQRVVRLLQGTQLPTPNPLRGDSTHPSSKLHCSKRASQLPMLTRHILALAFSGSFFTASDHNRPSQCAGMMLPTNDLFFLLHYELPIVLHFSLSTSIPQRPTVEKRTQLSRGSCVPRATP